MSSIPKLRPLDGGGVRLSADHWSTFWAVMVHVVRNAVDHGIEPPAERVRVGKPEQGAVLNGIEAARLIKASAATRESRIIAYTGNASIPPPIERWFVAVVPKPSTPDVVVAAVQNACDL